VGDISHWGGLDCLPAKGGILTSYILDQRTIPQPDQPFDKGWHRVSQFSRLPRRGLIENIEHVRGIHFRNLQENCQLTSAITNATSRVLSIQYDGTSNVIDNDEPGAASLESPDLSSTQPVVIAIAVVALVLVIAVLTRITIPS
jgi:hypothetical protein